MKSRNKEGDLLSEVELDSLLSNPPLPADRGFSSKIEIHVSIELRKARKMFWGVSAAWILVSSAALFKYFPSILQLLNSTVIDISSLTAIDFSGLAMFSITPLFLVTAIALLVFFAIVKITD